MNAYIMTSSLMKGKIWTAVFSMCLITALLISPDVSSAQQGSAQPNTANHTVKAQNQSLAQYLERAAKQNPGLKASFDNYLAKLQEAPQVSTLPDPEVAFGYFISPIETRVGPQEARFSFTQMFPWFGTLGARQSAKQAEARAAYESFQLKRNQLFYQVTSAWSDLFVIQEKLEILDEHIRILESLETIAMQKYETAQQDQGDVLQAQIEQEDLRIDRDELLDNREVLLQKFRALLHSDTLAMPDSISLQPMNLFAEPDVLKQRIQKQNPELNRLDFLHKSAEQSERAAKLNGLPSFGIGVDYIATGPREVALPDNGRDAILARASIKLPLYRKKYTAQKKQAEYRQSSLRQQQQSASNELTTQLEQALRNYRQGSRIIELYREQQINKTRQVIDILTDKYATAETDFEEILRLQRRLLNYQKSRKEALGKQHTSIARIKMLTGFHNTDTQGQTSGQ